MNSLVLKRSIILAGQKTSISLEDAFWTGLKEIAAARQSSLGALVTSIDTERQGSNLSSAIRLFVLRYFQQQEGSGRRSNGHFQSN